MIYLKNKFSDIFLEVYRSKNMRIENSNSPRWKSKKILEDMKAKEYDKQKNASIKAEDKQNIFDTSNKLNNKAKLNSEDMSYGKNEQDINYEAKKEIQRNLKKDVQKSLEKDTSDEPKSQKDIQKNLKKDVQESLKKEIKKDVKVDEQDNLHEDVKKSTQKEIKQNTSSVVSNKNSKYQTSNNKPRNKKKKNLGYRRRRNCFIIFLILIAVIIFSVKSCAGKSDEKDNKNKSVDTKESATVTDNSENNNEELMKELPSTMEYNGGTVRIAATGDNLIQTQVYESAAAKAAEGEYNFDYVYSGAAGLFEGADFSIINQETLICDDSSHEISGSYYIYNSPPALGRALLDFGFDAVSFSNNHMLDYGDSGLSACINYWDKLRKDYPDVLMYGAYKDVNDMENIRVADINGIRIALLAYTETTNGNSISEDSTLQIVYTEEEEKIKKQIEKANQVADVVLVSAHWGTEDTYEVNESVKDKAKKFINWGADVIIGNNPHVPQTMEYIDRGDGTKGFVFYSLGNFVSAQTYNINLVGEVANFDVNVDGATGNVSVENIQVRPIITQYDDGNLSNVRLIAYKDYNEELASAHGLPQAMYNEYGVWSMDKIKEIIDTAIPKEFQKLD